MHLDYEPGGKQFGFTKVSPTSEVLKQHIGKMCVYLRPSDIDKSGRGYLFPRYGIIDSVEKGQLIFDSNEVAIKDLEEIAIKIDTNAT